MLIGVAISLIVSDDHRRSGTLVIKASVRSWNIVGRWDGFGSSTLQYCLASYDDTRGRLRSRNIYTSRTRWNGILLSAFYPKLIIYQISATLVKVSMLLSTALSFKPGASWLFYGLSQM